MVWGFLISLVGTLPLGVLNIMALNISVAQGVFPAFCFSLGVVLIEMLYVYCTLLFIRRVQHRPCMNRYIHAFTLFFLLLVTFFGFYDAIAGSISFKGGKEPLHGEIPVFWLGLFMSAVNPVQVPFWLGWNSFLMSKDILTPHKAAAFIYVCSVGSGTLAGLAVFFTVGDQFKATIGHYEMVFKWVIALVFLILLVLHLYKMRKSWGTNASYKVL